MSARQDDDRRIAEIWVATKQLKRKLAASGLTSATFVELVLMYPRDVTQGPRLTDA